MRTRPTITEHRPNPAALQPNETIAEFSFPSGHGGLIALTVTDAGDKLEIYRADAAVTIIARHELDTPSHAPYARTLDIVSRALSVIENSEGADEHDELIPELRRLLNDAPFLGAHLPAALRDRHAATVALMQREILNDMRAGTVPPMVSTFSALHDYVDANVYGGFCDPAHENHTLDVGSDEDAAFVNACQDSVHNWLTTRGHLLPLVTLLLKDRDGKDAATIPDDCTLCDNGQRMPADEHRQLTFEDGSVQVFCAACGRCLQA